MPTICKVADFSYSNFIECIQKTKLQGKIQVVIPSNGEVVLYCDKCYKRLYDLSGIAAINSTEVINTDKKTDYTECKLFFVDKSKYRNEFKCALKDADSRSMLFDVITFVYTISVFNPITFVTQLDKIRPNYSRDILFSTVNNSIQIFVNKYCSKKQLQQQNSNIDRQLLLDDIRSKLDKLCCTKYGILLDTIEII